VLSILRSSERHRNSEHPLVRPSDRLHRHLRRGPSDTVQALPDIRQLVVGDGRVGDDLWPIFDRHLAGDDGRSALVAIIDDVEEIATPLTGKLSEAQSSKIDPR